MTETDETQNDRKDLPELKKQADRIQLQKEILDLYIKDDSSSYPTQIEDSMGELHNILEMLKDKAGPTGTIEYIQMVRDNIDELLLTLMSDLRVIRSNTDNDVLKDYEDNWDDHNQTYHVSDTEESTDSTE